MTQIKKTGRVKEVDAITIKRFSCLLSMINRLMAEKNKENYVDQNAYLNDIMKELHAKSSRRRRLKNFRINMLRELLLKEDEYLQVKHQLFPLKQQASLDPFRVSSLEIPMPLARHLQKIAL